MLLISGTLQLQGFNCESPISAAVEERHDEQGDQDHQSNAPVVWSRSMVGFTVNLVVCFSSAAGGVYAQKLLQTVDDSVNISNLKLYSFGAFWCLVMVLMPDASHVDQHNANDGEITKTNAYEQINFWGFVYILNQTMCGLVISRLVKSAGAVVKLFSQASSIGLVFIYGFLLEIKQDASMATVGLAMINIFVSLYIFVTDSSIPISTRTKL